jgi:hypothetical protein
MMMDYTLNSMEYALSGIPYDRGIGIDFDKISKRDGVVTFHVL